MYLEPTKEVGISVRWCPLSSSENVWHVLEVHPSSPAEIAGFIPFSDYIVGSPEGSLQSEAALGDLVEQVSLLSGRSDTSFFGGLFDSGSITQLTVSSALSPLFLIADGEVKGLLALILGSDSCIVYLQCLQRTSYLIQKLLCKLLSSLRNNRNHSPLKHPQDHHLSESQVILLDHIMVDVEQVTQVVRQARKSPESMIS